MKIEIYNTKRKELMDKAKSMLDAGNVGEDYQAAVADIESLDSAYDAENTAMANLEALSGRRPPINLSDLSATVQGGTVVDALGATAEDEDPLNSIEFRKAFMNHVVKGTAIPGKFRNANENTLTEDVGSTIPTLLIGKIVEKMETIGMILPLVTRTSYASGINIPTSGVKPVATWVAEGAGSDRQKTKTGVIVFTKHKLRCEISVSMEAHTMSIAAFEAMFVRQVSEAMVKANEEKIVSANAGTTGPRGILAETPNTGQDLTAGVLDYQLLIDAEAALPQAYETGACYFMSKKTFLTYMAMVDTTGQPIARTTYGIGGSPERSLLGRGVVLTGDYLPSFAPGLATGTIFAFLFKPSDYVFNTVYDMGIQRKQDWDTEDMLTKAVMSVDGRVIDKGSLVTIQKGASA